MMTNVGMKRNSTFRFQQCRSQAQGFEMSEGGLAKAGEVVAAFEDADQAAGGGGGGDFHGDGGHLGEVGVAQGEAAEGVAAAGIEAGGDQDESG